MIPLKSNRTSLLPVDEEFHNLFKSESAKRGLSMLEFSRFLAEQKKREEKENEAKDKKFNFPF